MRHTHSEKFIIGVCTHLRLVGKIVDGELLLEVGGEENVLVRQPVLHLYQLVLPFLSLRYGTWRVFLISVIFIAMETGGCNFYYLTLASKIINGKPHD